MVVDGVVSRGGAGWCITTPSGCVGAPPGNGVPVRAGLLSGGSDTAVAVADVPGEAWLAPSDEPAGEPPIGGILEGTRWDTDGSPAAGWWATGWRWTWMLTFSWLWLDPSSPDWAAPGFVGAADDPPWAVVSVGAKLGVGASSLLGRACEGES